MSCPYYDPSWGDGSPDMCRLTGDECFDEGRCDSARDYINGLDDEPYDDEEDE